MLKSFGKNNYYNKYSGQYVLFNSSWPKIGHGNLDY